MTNQMIYNIRKQIYKYLIAVLLFVILLITATSFNTSFCPDEAMRYAVPKYIFDFNILPLGDEPEIINGIWGFSYAFTPYLPSLFSVLFMKICSLFTTEPAALLVAARMVSVLSGTFTFFVCCSIGEELFEKKKYIYFFSIMVALLPQFVFLSSYVNNDAFSVFTTALILLYWIRGIKNKWDYKNCILLGISLGLCALTYYNAYGFILCSIFVYCISCYKLGFTFKEFFKSGMIIFISAFIIGGWFFIRNFIIHNGDFLGMSSMYECGEKYALDMYKMSNRQTLQVQGLKHPLLSLSWIITTLRTFFCATGYVEYVIGNKQMLVYLFIIIVPMIIGLLKYKMINSKLENYLVICLLLCMIIPILLSGHYSYAIDYQPQGRYIMSMLIPLMLFTTMGYKYLDEKYNKNISTIALGGYVLMFGYCFVTYFIPYFTSVII